MENVTRYGHQYAQNSLHLFRKKSSSFCYYSSSKVLYAMWLTSLLKPNQLIVFLTLSSDLQRNWHLNTSATAIPKPASSKPRHGPCLITAPRHAPIFPTNPAIGTFRKHGLISIPAPELLLHALGIPTSFCGKQHLPPIVGSSRSPTSVQEQPLSQQPATVGCCRSCRVWVWKLQQHPWN